MGRRAALPVSVRRPPWSFQVSVSMKSTPSAAPDSLPVAFYLERAAFDADAADTSRGAVSSRDAAEEDRLAVLHPIDEPFVEPAGAAGAAQAPHHRLVPPIPGQVAVNHLGDLEIDPFEIRSRRGFEPSAGHPDGDLGLLLGLEIGAGRLIDEVAEVDRMDVSRGLDGTRQDHTGDEDEQEGSRAHRSVFRRDSSARSASRRPFLPRHRRRPLDASRPL
jgi:hypothetical protein